MTRTTRNITAAGRPGARQILAVLGLCFTLGLYGQGPAHDESLSVTGVPRLVRVTDTFHPANGSPAAPVESVTLSVYREETGGAPLWQETHNVSVDSEGHYTALIGSTRTDGVPADLFSSNEPRWLGVHFNRTGETEQPRVRLASVPYALKATDAETLGGRPASDYLLSPGATAPGTTAGSAFTPTIGALGTTAPDTSASGKLKPKATNGTTNCIGVFTDATDIGCSNMWQVSGNIGIGTHTPIAPLQVVGTANPSTLIDTYGNSANLRQRRADNTVTSPTGVKIGEVIGNTSFVGYGTTGFLPFASAAMKAIAADNFTDSAGGGILTYSTMTGGTLNLVERMRIDQNGNVGIGTTAPGFKLDVDGGTINVNNFAISGFNPGVAGTSASANSAGVNGYNSYTGGGMSSYPVGVQGTVSGPTGAGVAGNANMAGAIGVNGFNSATSGFAPGVAGTSASANSAGVSGSNQYTAGAMGSFPTGVSGNVNGPTGAGVSGNASMAGAAGVSGYNGATSGFAPGVIGGTNSNGGAGVQGNANQAGAAGVMGFNNATSGNAFGVVGGTNSSGGAGVSGYNNATSGNAIGVAGGNNSNAGAGVQGNANQAGAVGVGGSNSATSGFAIGVQGVNNSTAGGGVLGIANSAGAFGVQGSSNATTGGGVGVFAESASPNGIALLAQSQTCGSNGCTIVSGTAALLETSTSGTLLAGISGAAGASNGSTTLVFKVDGVGNLIAAGVPLNNVSGAAVMVDSNGHFGIATSSRRFKEDIQDMGDATSGLMRLRPVTFRYKEPFADGSQPIQYGLIAEEVAEVYPDLVAHSADGQIETVKYQVLDSMLLNEVQRLNKENHDLQQRLSRLEAAVERLMAPNTQR